MQPLQLEGLEEPQVEKVEEEPQVAEVQQVLLIRRHLWALGGTVAKTDPPAHLLAMAPL